MNSEKKLSKGQRVMTFIHIILGGIFFCLFLVFFLPILGGTLNIGNITGMMFCAVMIFVTWGNKYYTKIIAEDFGITQARYIYVFEEEMPQIDKILDFSEKSV